jgi:hypothetical protein
MPPVITSTIVPQTDQSAAWTSIAQAGNVTRHTDYDARSRYVLQVSVAVAFGGTITADPIIRVLRSLDGGTNYDTNDTPYMALSVPRLVSVTRRLSFDLPPGQYRIQVVNADGTNSITTTVRLSTIDSYE